MFYSICKNDNTVYSFYQRRINTNWQIRGKCNLKAISLFKYCIIAIIFLHLLVED